MTDSTKQWGRNLFRSDVEDEIPETRGFWVRWQHQRGGVILSHSMLWHSDLTGSSEAAAQAMKLRWVCNLILGMVPDQGLMETLESLVRICEFYSLPTQPVEPQLRESARLLRAKVSRRTERPAFSLPEE
jgi:hypothetical protein